MNTLDILNSLVERGLAKKVSFSEIDNYDYNGVPPPKGWTMSSSFKMEITLDLPLFQQQIEAVLSRIEGVRYSWDNAKCVWHIEFGTTPIEYGKPGLEYRQIMLGKRAAEFASFDAINRFPHLVDYDDIFNVENNLVEQQGRWCKLELRLYTDRVKNCLFIQLDRMSGDRTSPWNIWREIYSHFSGNIFLSRASYLQFIEGTPFDRENPVQRYAADALVSRAICEFVPHD
jgi:hypothetical protein